MERANKMLNKSEEIGEVFRHFTKNDWVFDTRKSDLVMKMMNEEER